MSPDLNAFTEAYIVAALWSSTDNADESGGQPLDDNYGPEDIHPDTLKRMQEDCKDFWEAQAELLAGLDPEMAGHDFWLTRNRHGAGFWDRGLEALGERLTEACRPYGEFNLYVGDDGMIHGM